MLSVTMIGCGALGHGVLAEIERDVHICIDQIVTTPRHIETIGKEFPDIFVATRLEDLPQRPTLLLECAGHSAVVAHVLPALNLGVECIVCSIGALAEPGMLERLETTARERQTQVQLVSGAVGGIDAIAAASIGGLERVIYTGRKPPHGWQGTPAEEVLDLDSLAEPSTFFRGSAREAARQFPKNANVAATVSLAGLGLDETEVQLIADPSLARNQHQVHAEGTFGELELQLANFPLPANPKTSALTAYSAVRALRNRAMSIAI